MANFAHANDCLNYMYLRSGDSTASPNFAANALMYLNLAHRDMIAGTTRLVPNIVATFPWAKSAQPKTLVLEPVESGTITVTQGSSTITFASPPAASKAGFHLIILSVASDTTTYRIDSHTGGNASATLDSAIVHASGSVSAFWFKIDYTVGSSDILRFIDVFGSNVDPGFGTGVYQLIPETEDMFRRAFPTVSEGTPTHFTILYETEGTFTIRFNKYLAASTYKRLEIPYIPLPSDLTASDSSIPLVPRHHRPTLCDLALTYLFQDKNDDRVDGAVQSASAGLLSMMKEIGMKDVTFMPFKPNEEVKVSV